MPMINEIEELSWRVSQTFLLFRCSCSLSIHVGLLMQDFTLFTCNSICGRLKKIVANVA